MALDRDEVSLADVAEIQARLATVAELLAEVIALADTLVNARLERIKAEARGGS